MRGKLTQPVSCRQLLPHLAVRVSNGLTQKAFASVLGLNTSSISLLEKNKRRHSLQLLYGICRTFNVNKEWLETGKEPGKGETLVKAGEPAVNEASVKGVLSQDAADEIVLRFLQKKPKKGG